MNTLNDLNIKSIKKIINDRVSFGQSLLINRDKTPLKYWPHQVDELRSPAKFIVHRDGRGVGKSKNLNCIIMHDALTTTEEILVGTPGESSLAPIIHEFEFQKNNNPLIAASIKKIERKPYYTVFLNCGSVIHFRMAGSQGLAFRGLHVKKIRLDEAAFFTKPAMDAIFSCFEIGSERSLIAWSTPNGIRDRQYYQMTYSDKYEQYHWPSTINPNWTSSQWDEKLDFYGGEKSPGFQHEVLGEHGDPSFGVFDMDLFADALTEIPEFNVQNISGQDLHNEAQIPEFLQLPENDGKFIVGCDLGFATDPSEIIVFKIIGNSLRLVYRLHLERVKYPLITKIIKYMLNELNIKKIGIDEGNNGIYVGQELNEIIPTNFDEDKLIMIPFGGSTEIGIDEKTGKFIKTRNKPFMVQLIQGALIRGELQLPVLFLGQSRICKDRNMENQFSQYTYSTTSSGLIVFSKGNDHIIDAMGCAKYAFWHLQQNDGMGGIYI